MMLAPRCFSRVTLVLLSVILGLLLFTALRVHNGIPPTVSITAAQSMVENLAGEWFHLDRQHPGKVSPFTPQVDNGAEEPKPPELLEGKASRNLARPPELEYLRQEKFGLTDTILYTQACIKPIYDQTINRNLINNITEPFISDKSTISINLHDDTPLPSPTCSILPIAVPTPYPKTRHPELIFGAASTYSRLSSPATLSAFAHWLSNSRSRLILTITDYHSLPPTDTLSSLSKLYHSHSILATALPPAQPPSKNTKNYTTPQLHFLLLSTLLSFSTPQTTYLSLLDDDTFFPSLFTLSLSLSRYNPSLPLYLGAKSDSKAANKQYGDMAFGGAGIFISVPLAKQLVPYYKQCAAAAAASGDGELGGDGILRDCVYNYTETRLTELRGLWQGDVRGDVSGVFEGGGGGPVEYRRGMLQGRREEDEMDLRGGGGAAVGERGTGDVKETRRTGERERESGGGAAGERGTGNIKGKWTSEKDRGVAPRDLQHLPNRIWVSMAGFIDRVTGSADLRITVGNKTENRPCGSGRERARTRPYSSELVRRGGKTDEQSSPPPPLLSLHHWRSWFHAPVDKMAGVNEVCGDCFLQRWRTGVGENETSSDNKEKRKGLWVNGYSYTEYSPGSFPTDEDLQKVEGTWLYADEGDYKDAYGPLRQRLGEGEKKQWLLVDAYWTRDNKGWRGQKKQFRQLYVYRAPRVLPGEEGENKKAVDEVLEIVWDI